MPLILGTYSATRTSGLNVSRGMRFGLRALLESPLSGADSRGRLLLVRDSVSSVRNATSGVAVRLAARPMICTLAPEAPVQRR